MVGWIQGRAQLGAWQGYGVLVASMGEKVTGWIYLDK